MTTKNTTPAKPFVLELVGKVATEPELRQLQNGAKVCNFRLAVDVPKDEYGYVTMWFRVAAWDDHAETIHSTVRKGKIVRVKASFVKASAFTGRQGDLLTTLEVTAAEIEVLR